MPAILTVSITVPDADIPDLLASLKIRYATNGNPNPTQAQLRSAVEGALRQEWIALVTQYRRDQAAIVSPALT